MRLSELIAGLPIAPRPGSGLAEDPDVTGVTLDSRTVASGDLFVAVPGLQRDGQEFAGDAVARGAVAVLAAGPPRPEAGAAVNGTAWLETESPRALAGPLAARVYGYPHREMTVAAVTGTNGKSSLVALMTTLLEAAGRPTARFGTLGYGFGDDLVKGDRTTPEAPLIHRLLRRWREQGAEAATMEASSHALALDRLGGLELDVAVFTNLTQDHFDYHGDFETYFAAKRRLFGLLKPEGRAVVNAGDGYGRRLLAEIPGAIGFGEGGSVRALEVDLAENGTSGLMETPRGSFRFRSVLLGRFNLENLEATAAVGEALGLDHEVVAGAIAGQPIVPGRLEPVEHGQAFPIYIDYAHSPGALESVLRSVAELSGRRIIVLFGAGGDRDRGKREPMGRIAGELAGLPILTSDNPRGEDPLDIIRMVEVGLRASGSRGYRIVPDRREAIRRAVGVAGPGDVIVVTGKGHERVQEIGGEKLPFSDRDELVLALEERFDKPASR